MVRLRSRRPLTVHERALWLHRSCARVLEQVGGSIESRGTRPRGGLLVANHLSYLDIAAFAAVLPCVFISKKEVSRWPGIGLLATLGGTIFLDRQNRNSTRQAAEQIRKVLEADVAVLLFPEGTSTDGSVVLRFHPSLLQPAIDLGEEVTAAAISYRLPGHAERDACYFGDVRFLSHLWWMLGRRGLEVEVEFHPDRSVFFDRKVAALELREKVVALRQRMMRGRC